MSFLNNASKGSNLLSTYFLTIILVILAYVILGQIPLLIELATHQDSTDGIQNVEVVLIAKQLGNNKFLTFLIIPFIFSLAAILFSIRYLHKRPVLSVFTNRSTFDWKRFFTSAFIWGIIMCFFLMITFTTGNQIEWNFNPETFIPLLLISLFLIPIQTTCEEVLFRGYLLQGFGHFYKKGLISILITGLLFGLMHGANPEVQKLGGIVMVYYIGTGIFLGVMTLMDDGLELSMGYHAMNNIFASLILTNEWQAFQTDALFIDHSKPSFGWDALLTIILIQPLLLFIFSKLYKWKNWKNKFLGTSDRLS